MRVMALLFVLMLAVAAPAQTSEGDLVKKAREDLRLAENALTQARQKYSEGYPEEGQKGVEEMLKQVEQAFTALGETRRDPRKKPGGFKDMELKLRAFIRRLVDLKGSLPQDEREPVEKAITRLHEIDDDLVLGLMHAKHPDKKEK